MRYPLINMFRNRRIPLKRLIPFAIAFVLMIVISVVSYHSYVKETYQDVYGNVTKEDYLRIFPKYQYTKDEMSLGEYYAVFGDTELPIILQDEVQEERAFRFLGKAYLTAANVEHFFTDRFYYNEEERVLMMATATQIISASIPLPEEADPVYGYTLDGSFIQTDYPVATVIDDTLYIALDYVQLFVDFTYELLEDPGRIQIYTQEDVVSVASVLKATQLRYTGGIKGRILQELTQEEEVVVLDKMENWSCVKTSAAVIGWVENDCLSEHTSVTRQISKTAIDFGYEPLLRDYPISLVWHQLWAANGGSDLVTALQGTEGINVVSPTWYRLSGNEGDISSISNQSYVNKAHELGMEVWAVLTDVDTTDIDLYAIFSSTTNRLHLIDGVIEEAIAYGVDGINVDIEGVKSDTGEHFVQFLRELAIATKANGLVLSVDNYYPNESNKYYNLKEQALVTDYVILMGYDEHWAGRGVAGSVSSIGFVQDGISKALEKVPANQLINAVPFYTRVWFTTDGVTTDDTLSMINTQEWLDGRNKEGEWDITSGQNLVQFESGSTLYQCWLEDEDSLLLKLQVVKNKNLAGVAAWKLGMEDKSVWPLFTDYLNNTLEE